MLCDGVGIESGSIAHLHPTTRAGGKIDVVIAGANLHETQPRCLRKKIIVDADVLRNYGFGNSEMSTARRRRSDDNLPLVRKSGAHTHLGSGRIITDDKQIHGWLISPADGRRRGSSHRCSCP